MNDQWKLLIANVCGDFGWHGGVGDPPDDVTIIAIAKGVIDHMCVNGSPVSTKHDDEPEETRDGPLTEGERDMIEQEQKHGGTRS